jgi:antirestriction protein ArdC
MKISTSSSRTDLYTRVTDRVVAQFEKGVRPWLQPWNAGHAAGRTTLPLRHNGTPYRGINVLLLWGEAMADGYTSPRWLTFKQALALEAHVADGGDQAWEGARVMRTNITCLLVTGDVSAHSLTPVGVGVYRSGR